MYTGRTSIIYAAWNYYVLDKEEIYITKGQFISSAGKNPLKVKVLEITEGKITSLDLNFIVVFSDAI